MLAADIPRLEVDEGDENDRSDLEALAAAAAGPAEGWSERVGPLMDLGRMTTAFALEHYVHHWGRLLGARQPVQPEQLLPAL